MALPASFVVVTELAKFTAYASSPPSASVEVASAGKMPAFEDFVAVLTSSASIAVAMTSASRTFTVVEVAAIRLGITIMVKLYARMVAKVAKHH